jgi:hypothetical protein
MRILRAIVAGDRDPASLAKLSANRVSGILRMAAVSVQRSKTALGAAFRRIARIKSNSVAVFAVARKLAQLVYRMLRFGHEFVDIGDEAYNKLFEKRRLEGLKMAAKSIGYAMVKIPENCEVSM